MFQAEDGIRDHCVTGVQTCSILVTSRRRHTRSLCDWSSDVCSSDLGSTATEPNPAASSTARTLPGSASENGPGSAGPGIGGKDPVTDATAAPGISIHSLSNTLCQQTKDSAPPGLSARRTLPNAAAGSAKNITPNRE